MDFSPTEEQNLLVQEATQFLTAEWTTEQRRRMLGDEAGAASTELWKRMVELGWPALRAPESVDGLDASVFETTLLAEAMGRRLTPGEFFGSAVLAVEALRRFGDASGRMEAIASGEVRATVAIWEPGVRWELGVQTGGTVRKTLVESAAGADLILALVRIAEDRVELLEVAEAAIEEFPALDATRPLAGVSFDYGKATVVGTGGEAELSGLLDVATVFLASEMTGAAQQSLDDTVSYVTQRKQFGVAVGGFQAVQQRAAEMLAIIEKARSAVQYAALAADESPEDLPRAASAAKVCANQAAVYCAEQSIQLHGGMGFTWEQDLHLYLKRAKAAEVTLGDSAFHLDRIARSLGLDAA